MRELSLRSHGGAPVTLGVSAITGPNAGTWTLAGDCVAERVLEPGSACNVRLTWTAGAPGPAEAAVQWRSSGASPGTVSLSGRSTAAAVPGAAAPAPEATASPPSGGSGGGSIGVGFVALLAWAAWALVIDRSRQRHAHVTRAS